MKTYFNPETKSLQVNAQNMICAGSAAPTPQRGASINTMEMQQDGVMFL